MSDSQKPLVCGIVMPISSIDGCSEKHWQEVRDILHGAITDAGFEPNLVSESDDVGVIHKRIIQNLYENPIVVCDISCRNANVMFELGLRLAFDKPTIILKDDKTPYSFDTSAIEHLEYPRDLRFQSIVSFKLELRDKIHATYKRSVSDSNYTTFLKHFGEFKVAKIEKKEVSGQEYILEQLKTLTRAVQRIETNSVSNPFPHKEKLKTYDGYTLQFILVNATESVLQLIQNEVTSIPYVAKLKQSIRTENTHQFYITAISDRNPVFVQSEIANCIQPLLEENMQLLIGEIFPPPPPAAAIQRTFVG